jgi:sugar phosphate isomerase/epimerase
MEEMNQELSIAKPLALQLYTVRAEADLDLAAVLERTAEIGYLGVEVAEIEGAGVGTTKLHGMTLAEFRARLDALDLNAIGMHIFLSSKEDVEKAEQTLDDQETIGSKTALVSLLPEHFASLDAIDRTAERFNEFAAIAAKRGIKLGYHNHWWEFERSSDGWVPMWKLLERLDPGVFLEVDVYWLQTAGFELAGTLKDLGPRVGRLHLKDGPCNSDDPQTAVGTGRVDIAGAVAAAPGVDWHAVELDEFAGDMFEAVEESYRYLIGKKLSTGRKSEVAR